MPEWRKDPILNRWVIVAEGRGERPCDYERPRLRETAACPFCEGNEAETTPEVAACRAEGTAANGPGWRVRVLPNKYPALAADGETRGNGLAGGLGVHEVIVESPRHLASVSDLSEEHLREVLWTYRERLAACRRDPRLKYATIFKNVGPAAGASLEHAHSQLLATPLVPPQIQAELDAAEELFRRNGACAYCALLDDERRHAARLVHESPHFAAFCPFASRFPYETWIVPQQHASRYEDISPPAARDLAGVWRQVVLRIEGVLDRPAYNVILHTAPFGDSARCDGELPHYHWRLEVFPRLANAAGLEWGTGLFVNTVPPEAAAARLREVQLHRAPTPPLSLARC